MKIALILISIVILWAKLTDWSEKGETKLARKVDKLLWYLAIVWVAVIVYLAYIAIATD